MLPTLLLLLLIPPLTTTSTQPPSLTLTVYHPGILALESALYTQASSWESRLTDPGEVAFPRLTTDQYELNNLHVTQLSLTRPQLEVVSGEGVRMSQGVSSGVIDGNYRVKALFFWVDGELTVRTSFDLTVMLGVVPTSCGGLKPVVRSCDVNFNSFELDLHSVFLTAIASLMKGTTKDVVKDKLCEKVVDSIEDVTIMKDLREPTAIFSTDSVSTDSVSTDSVSTDSVSTDSVSISGRILEDTNESAMPDMLNSKGRMMCMMLSKHLVKNISGKSTVDEEDVVEVARKFAEVMSGDNVDFREDESFVQVCADANFEEELSASGQF